MTRSLRFTTTLLGLALAFPGCAPGNPALVILGNIAPDDECVYDPSTSTFQIGGMYDVSAEGAYRTVFAVENGLLNRFSTQFPVMADPNVVTAHHAEVEVLRSNGAASNLGTYTVPASGVLQSASGDQRGRGVVSFDLVPTSRLESVGNHVDSGDESLVFRVRVLGTTAGGAEVESSPFVLQIGICSECLRRGGVPPEDYVVCNRGQDRPYY